MGNSGVVGLGLSFAPGLPRHAAFATAMRFLATLAASSSENVGAFFRQLLMVGRHFGTIFFFLLARGQCACPLTGDLRHRGSAEHTSLLWLVCYVHNIPAIFAQWLVRTQLLAHFFNIILDAAAKHRQPMGPCASLRLPK